MPIRLNPDGEGEAVVWARRIDPARAILENIPFPESGYGLGDLVLHDGAPAGYRLRDGVEVPVFPALALLAPGDRSTWVVHLQAPGPEDMQALQAMLGEAGLAMEDWSQSVRWLCKACSEGRPHERHAAEPAPAAWRAQCHVGVAAGDEPALRRTLAAWARAPGRAVPTVECGLRR